MIRMPPLSVSKHHLVFQISIGVRYLNGTSVIELREQVGYTAKEEDSCFDS